MPSLSASQQQISRSDCTSARTAAHLASASSTGVVRVFSRASRARSPVPEPPRFVTEFESFGCVHSKGLSLSLSLASVPWGCFISSLPILHSQPIDQWCVWRPSCSSSQSARTRPSTFLEKPLCFSKYPKRDSIDIVFLEYRKISNEITRAVQPRARPAARATRACAGRFRCPLWAFTVSPLSQSYHRAVS